MPEISQVEFRSELALARQAIETAISRMIEKYIIDNVSNIDSLIPNSDNKQNIYKKILDINGDYEKKISILDEITAHDKCQILFKYIKFLPQDLKIDIEDSKHDLMLLVGRIRGQTDAHTHFDRPIDYDNYKFVITFLHKKVDTKLEDWRLFTDFLDKIQSYSFEEENNPQSTLVNLPPEDYKATNFCGRGEVFTKAYRLIVEQERHVVSFIGIGGYGKTALANYLVRHINRKNPDLFKKVFWYSAKDSYIDESGRIEKIMDPVKSFNEFTNSPDENSSKSINEYIDEGNILIVLDNFETMNEEDAKKFIKKYASPRCRFLITSRRSLGELEEKIKIERLEDFEAEMMVNNFTSTFNIQAINEIQSDDLREHLNKLDNSPLHIRWFLNSLRKSNNIFELMSAGKKSDIIKFTFENTLNDLLDSSKKIIDILIIQQKFSSILFIKILTKIKDLEFDHCIRELKDSVLIQSQKQKISLRPEVISYFNTIGYEVKDFLQIRRKLLSLNGMISEYIRKDDFKNEDFSLPENIVARNEDEAIAASQLTEIFRKYKGKRKKIDRLYILDFNDHQEKINELKALKRLMNDYPEIDYAIGNSYFDQEDYPSAKTHIISGLQNVKNSILLKRRLLHKLCAIYDRLHDYENLLKYSIDLYDIDQSPRSIIQLAEAYGEVRDIDKANELYFKVIDESDQSPYELNLSSLSQQVIASYGFLINSYTGKDHYEKYWPKIEEIALKLKTNFDYPLILSLHKIAGRAMFKYGRVMDEKGLNSKLNFYKVFDDLHDYFKEFEPGSKCETYLKNIDLEEIISKSDVKHAVAVNKHITGSDELKNNNQLNSNELKNNEQLNEALSIFYKGKVEKVLSGFLFVSIDEEQQNYNKLTYMVREINYKSRSNYFFISNRVLENNCSLVEGQIVSVQFAYDYRADPEKRIFGVKVIT